MAVEIIMPKLSDTMTEGRFGSWRKHVGDEVARGDVVAEIETDKAVMELEAFASGVLVEQRAVSGDLIPVGMVIGLIAAPGEEPVLSPPAPVSTAQEIVPPAVDQGGGDHEPMAGPPFGGMSDAIAAPIVRRRAREMGIDLALVTGSGPGGRILPEDLERFSRERILTDGISPGRASADALSPPPSPLAVENVAPSTIQPEALPAGEIIPHSRMRTAIARTVTESWRTIPHFYLSSTVSMDAADEIRREVQLSGNSLTVHDLVVKATAMALVKYPLLNAVWTPEGVVSFPEVRIGIAVALADGLLIPVLDNCGNLGLMDIAVALPTLVARARTGHLTAAELTGGTFTISNLGMHGVRSFAPIVQPGQAAILAVGEVSDRAVVKNGMPAVGKEMILTLAADHRLLDGAYAADFLAEIRTLLEAPAGLLL